MRAVSTRRSFLRSSLRSAAWLAGGAGAAWLLRDQVFWPAPDAASIEGGASSGWLPFVAPRGLRLVTVEVGLNGRAVTALLDSGAQYSVVDRAFAEAAGLRDWLAPPLVAYGVGGQPQLGQGVRLDLTLGDMRLNGLRAASLALGPLAQAVGSPVPLILGQDVLQALVADIDFPLRRVAFRRGKGYAPPEPAVPADARRVGRALHAQVTVEGAPLEVLVDTGSSAALALSTETARAAGLLDGRPVRANRSVVLGGVVEGGAVRVETLSFGGQVLRDAEMQLFRPVAAPGFPKGLLGVEALRRRRAILDLAGGRLHLMRSESRS